MVFADSKGEISIGDRSAICRYAVIQAAGGNISIGSHTIIGDFCSLYGQGGLIIGDKVMIASGCRIIPNQHTFENIDLPIIDQHCKSSGISIQDGVWMGSNAIVLDGVHIGQGAIIGAGSVVTHSIPAFSIAVGVPARVIRTRPGHVLRS
jgi:acetyltransferase-like isoleucine patch superfamily enzyme